MKKAIRFSFVAALFCLALLNLYCGQQQTVEADPPYVNHSDTVTYVGKEACKNCHPAIYESFRETGMGMSFAPATKQKSVASFGAHQVVHDKVRNLSYYPFWRGDSMYITEFRLQGKDTIHQRTERVDYIIGSGQHTNSHLTSINGFLYQLPLTWYAQKGKWDLPPGFENGRNVRFSRGIEYECMSCHNALPNMAPGSVNKYLSVPSGIDCERCHGPGSAHVNEKLKGVFIDTSKYIDYSIVNPRKLSWERQIDLCQRCHLQGNAVLKPGKQFSDFKPGMRLNKVVDVFLPKYTGQENEFIMASHAQRLQESKCFIQSNKSVKPVEGKNFATLNLTCITCHNPHVSVKKSGVEQFNNACINCHGNNGCSKLEDPIKITLKNDNCVSCHMPGSGATDIPHVSVHDHKIRIPVTTEAKNNIRTFAGLTCVNNTQVEPAQRANAFLNYFEKFEGEQVSLDSANALLKNASASDLTLHLYIHYAYLRNDWQEVRSYASELKNNEQKDPWLYYRIGQACQNVADYESARTYYLQALALAPENLQFLNKLGIVYSQLGLWKEAKDILTASLNKQPKQEDTWVNLGFVYVNLNNKVVAMQHYNQALRLNPDHTQALLNRAALHNLNKNIPAARADLNEILRIEPNNVEVRALLARLGFSTKP